MIAAPNSDLPDVQADLQEAAPSARLANRMTEPNSARRLAVVGVLVLALFAGLLTRLWFLQVTGGEKLAVAAQRQRDRFVKVPAMRGTIYDRNGIVLAQTVPVTSLTVNRQQLSTTERTTLETNLANLLHKTPDDVAKLIDNTNYAAFEPVPVAKDIDQATAVYFAEHRSEFPEADVSTTTERRYPQDFTGRRRRRLPRADQRRRAARRTRRTGTTPATPSARSASRGCTSPSCAGSRARTRSRSTTRAARSTWCR